MVNNRVGGKVYRYPVATVNMTDEDVINRVSVIFETKTYKLPKIEGRKQAYRAQVSGVKAATLMQAMLPHMGQRRALRISNVLDEYGQIESTEVRRRRSCKEAYARRVVDGKTGRLLAS